MALVHRSDDYLVGPARRSSDDLSEKLRAEYLRDKCIAKYKNGERNGHKEIIVEEASVSD